MKIIPLTKLKGACRRKLRLVKRQWPDGIPVSMKSVAVAIKLGLSIDWLARKLLEPPAWGFYQQVSVPAWNAYLRDDSFGSASHIHLQTTIGKELVRLLRKQKECVK